MREAWTPFPAMQAPSHSCEVTPPDILGRCLRVHPKARIEARVARNTELLDRIDTNELDLALVRDDSVSPGLSFEAAPGKSRSPAPHALDRVVDVAVESQCRTIVAAGRIGPGLSVFQRGNAGPRWREYPMAGGFF